MRVVQGLQSLLLARRGVLDVFGQGFLDRLGSLLLLRLAGDSWGCGFGLLLLGELGVLLGLLALSLYCMMGKNFWLASSASVYIFLPPHLLF